MSDMQMVLGNPQRDHNPWVENHCSGKNLTQNRMAWHGECCALQVQADLGPTGKMPFSSALLPTLLLSSKEGREERGVVGGRR